MSADMKNKRLIQFFGNGLALTAGLALSATLWAAPPKLPPLKPKPYPLDKCLVSGEKLGQMGKPVVKVYEGREFQFCCRGCVKKFEQDPQSFVARHDAAWKKVKPYPLTTCIVSGDKLGEMGKPVGFVFKGQEIRLCCPGCRKAFDKNPDRFLKKLPGS